MNLTKKAACSDAYDYIASYEKITFSTLYRRAYRLPNGNWHYVGRAHDYTF